MMDGVIETLKTYTDCRPLFENQLTLDRSVDLPVGEEYYVYFVNEPLMFVEFKDLIGIRK